MSKMLQRIAPILIVLGTTCATAMADDVLPDGRLVGYPDKIGITPPSTAAAWFLLVGLGLVTLGPMFLNAHRTHLD
ncbi:MAG TPA: hypothetical protein VHP11_00430 [Tepidisphaeraceae bacterium]|nr:hypothetical protein [Tepidisphaeraceae bacterium]